MRIAVYTDGGIVCRDATPEELAEMEQLEAVQDEPTIEEQMADLVEYVDVLAGMLMGGIDYGD